MECQFLQKKKKKKEENFYKHCSTTWTGTHLVILFSTIKNFQVAC